MVLDGEGFSINPGDAFSFQGNCHFPMLVPMLRIYVQVRIALGIEDDEVKRESFCFLNLLVEWFHADLLFNIRECSLPD